jgi:hypothetical protein
VTVFVVRQSVAQTWSAWRPALESAGLVLERVSEGEYGISATLCEGSCEPNAQRYALLLSSFGEQASHGYLIPALARAPVELSGACAAIPETSFSIIEHRSGHGFDRYQNKQLDIEQDYRWGFGPRHRPKRTNAGRAATCTRLIATRWFDRRVATLNSGRLASPDQMKRRARNGEHNEHPKQDLGDRGGSRRDPAEAKDGGDDGDDEENERVVQHE